MSIFSRLRKKGPERIEWDPSRQRPGVRRSICTGEMTAVLIDKETGRPMELYRLDGPEGLAAYCAGLGVEEEDLTTIY